MNLYTLFSIIFSLAVAISYINHHFIKLQSTIATTLAALIISLGILLLSHLGYGHLTENIVAPIRNLDFYDILINGMLSFLLFAGALNIDVSHLKNEKVEVTVLALLGTVLSTFIIAYGTHFALNELGIKMPLIYCLLFGALISPTDPIAVLAIFKNVGAPKKLDVRLAGESLFNDGVGVVLFITFYQLAYSGNSLSTQEAFMLFFREAFGGIAYGFILGYLGHALIKTVHEYKLEILITLVITSAGYLFAQHIGISGPIAMVVCGLVIGYHREKQGNLDDDTKTNLDHFWELADDTLNTILFMVIGLELTALTFHMSDFTLIIAAILITLIARVLSVGLPMSLFRLKRQYTPLTTSIMIWGGLRGGLALAMALSLPITSPWRDTILTMTYGVVIFSILVQGMTIKPLVVFSQKMEKQTR